jgi:hypothetical protein
VASRDLTTSPHDPAAVAPDTPATPQAMVEKLVVLAARLVGEQLIAVANNLSGALLDVTGPDEAKVVYQRVKSGNLLKQNCYAFVHVAVRRIEAALLREAALLAPAPRSDSDATHDDLALVPMAEMDSKVAFGAISRPFDIEFAEPLATLNVRLAYLLDREILRNAQNPFRPEVFLAELDGAWREFEPDESAHALIQPLLRPGIVCDFGPVYEALNQSLKRNGRQGAAFDKRQIRKSADGASRQDARATSQAALALQLRQFFGDGAAPAGVAMPMIPDLPDMPQGAGGWRPSGAAAFSGPHGAHASSIAPAGSTVTQAGHADVPPTAGFAHQVMNGASAAPAYASQYPVGAAPQLAPFAMPGAPMGSAMVPAPAHLGPLLDMLANLPHLPQLSHSHGLPALASGANAVPGTAPASTHASAPVDPAQLFYLPRLKQSLPAGSLSRGDESTLDLLSRIFETVFLDEAIPAPTRELIQSLQMPVLKAALTDKNFFFEEAHPARRMIDLLSRMGWDQGQDAGDPLFQAMAQQVRRVEREGASQPEVFAEAVAELEQSLLQEEHAAEVQLQAQLQAQLAGPVAVALRQEHIAVARRAANDAVRLRIAGDNVTPVVGAFLENKWRDVLTLAYDVEEKKPGAVNNAMRTMDDLVWSVKPKATLEQRKALIARLPGLLATINKWLDIIKWQDAARLQFFAALAECHASIVRAPIDLSPERQLELAVEAAQQDALRMVAQEQAQAAFDQVDLAASDPVVQAVDELERGRWLAFTAPGEDVVRRVKLAWVSPRRTLFIFSAGAREDAFSMPAELLAARLRDGSATILALEGVVGRVLSEAMQQAAGNEAHLVAA